MRHFEISDRYTTADIGLDFSGDTLEESFQAAAEGMFAIIFGPGEEIAASSQYTVNLRTTSREQLLIDWLSELIYRFDAEGLVPLAYDLMITETDREWSLKATVGCREYNRSRDKAEHEIKAVTYYKTEIKEEAGRFCGHVVFDL